jgi:hypothetical protein
LTWTTSSQVEMIAVTTDGELIWLEWDRDCWLLRCATRVMTVSMVILNTGGTTKSYPTIKSTLVPGDSMSVRP